MPNLQDFIEEIEKTGITIEGREKFIEIAATATSWPAWPAVVCDLVRAGRKRGDIRLIRHAANAPSDEAIHKILRGYPFEPAACFAIVQNVITVE